MLVMLVMAAVRAVIRAIFALNESKGRMGNFYSDEDEDKGGRK